MAGDTRAIRPREVPFGCFEIEREGIGTDPSLCQFGRGRSFSRPRRRQIPTGILRTARWEGPADPHWTRAIQALPPALWRVPTANAMKQRAQKQEPSAA